MSKVVGYCCGMVGADKKLHQLWCAEHPDKKKRNAEPEKKPPSNSEQAEVDEIAKGIGASLDAGHAWKVSWDSTWGERCWSPDGQMSFKTCAVDNAFSPRRSTITVFLKDTGQLYTSHTEATASQDHIWDAFKRWQHKRFIAHLNPGPPPPPPPPPPPRIGMREHLARWWKGDPKP